MHKHIVSAFLKTHSHRVLGETLDEKDLWKLSPTMQSRPVFIKFVALQCSTLLRRLWAANSRWIYCMRYGRCALHERVLS